MSAWTMREEIAALRKRVEVLERLVIAIEAISGRAASPGVTLEERNEMRRRHGLSELDPPIKRDDWQ